MGIDTIVGRLLAAGHCCRLDFRCPDAGVLERRRLVCGSASARIRYLICCGGLFFLYACLITTFLQMTDEQLPGVRPSNPSAAFSDADGSVIVRSEATGLDTKAVASSLERFNDSSEV